MKKQLNLILIVSLALSMSSFSSPIKRGFPKPPSVRDYEKNPRDFLKLQRDYERMREALYTQDMEVELYRFIVKNQNRMNKIKAKLFSRRNKGIRGKTLYYYQDFKNKRMYYKLKGIDVVNVDAVFLTRPFSRRLRTKRSFKIKRYFDNVIIQQVGVSPNYRYSNRARADNFVKEKLEVLTIRRKPQFYRKKYDINVYKLDNRIPPKINKVIIYNRNQRIFIRNTR
jgi:hypothetical protein